MLSEDELKHVPVLVFANKQASLYISSPSALLISIPQTLQDVQGALSPAEISDKLGLAGGEKGREWSVRGSCATKGEGLEEGLDWLVNTIQK
jgi:ADP-ribosylation factor-like protein 1